MSRVGGFWWGWQSNINKFVTAGQSTMNAGRRENLALTRPGICAREARPGTTGTVTTRLRRFRVFAPSGRPLERGAQPQH